MCVCRLFFLESGGKALIAWMMRQCNVCQEGGPADKKSACIVPIYKGNGNRN